MYYKALIMEIKEDCCIVMLDDSRIARIKKKEGLCAGQKIYVLDEDFYNPEESKKNAVVLPFIDKKIKKSVFTKIAAAAAALMVFVGAMAIPQFTDRTYAAVSFDGKQSVQIELDDEKRVIKAESYDKTLTEDELDAMQGKELDEIWDELMELSDEDDTLLVAGAYMKKDDSGKADNLKKEIYKRFTDKSLIYVQGGKTDVKEAAKQEKSLGIYIMEKAVDEDAIEDYFDDAEFSSISEFIEKNRGKMPETYKKFMMIIEDDDESEQDDQSDDETSDDESDEETAEQDDDADTPDTGEPDDGDDNSVR